MNRTYLALIFVVSLLVGGFALPTHARAPDPPPTLVLDVRNLPVTGGAAINTSTIVYVAPTGRTGSTAYRVHVHVVGTNSVFNVDHGDDLAAAALNDGTTLTAGRVYTFTISATDQDALTFTATTSTTIGRLIVERIAGGVM